MSMIFRTKEWMTVGQLVRAWASELVSAGGGDPQQFERDLLHTLMEDIVNGRLDNSGPFREGQRSGVRLITPANKGAFIEGHQLRDLAPFDPANRWVLDHILVMKEATLDFAKRRQLPAPSWWANGADSPTGFSSTGATTAVPITRAELGKKPRIRQYLAEHYPEGVPDPAYCPRKALKDALLKWDQSLSPLDESTLKKAINEYNANFPKPPAPK
jgi:hypothetical protein